MRYLITVSVIVTFFISCTTKQTPIVSSVFVDSLMLHFTEPQAIKTNQADLLFWSSRISSHTPDYSNTSKYAAALVTRFHFLGDITDLKKSDSLLINLSSNYNDKEVGPLLTLVSHAILQHRFQLADSLLTLSKLMGLKKYEAAASSFDVDFELGRILEAADALKTLKQENDFGYQFRKSKMMHFRGELDSSVVAMEKAVENAGHDQGLRLAALSNLGDLYLHAGKMDQAYQIFINCLKENDADLHSLIGIGWISLVKDRRDSLAEKIFKFVSTKTASPEPLFKLVAVAEQRSDSLLQLKYATDFEAKVCNPLYGNMYNKYMIQLYTGILNNPGKAVAIALAELKNRNTPQTNAWYVWSLLCNHQQSEAYRIYQKYVAGKPLEGLELYWMGKLMHDLNKGYNAKQYFEEAYKNQSDLNPSVTKDLTKLLKD